MISALRCHCATRVVGCRLIARSRVGGCLRSTRCRLRCAASPSGRLGVRRRSRRENRSPRLQPVLGVSKEWEPASAGDREARGGSSYWTKARQPVDERTYRPLKRALNIGLTSDPPAEAGGYGSHADSAGERTPHHTDQPTTREAQTTTTRERATNRQPTTREAQYNHQRANAQPTDNRQRAKRNTTTNARTRNQPTTDNARSAIQPPTRERAINRQPTTREAQTTTNARTRNQPTTDNARSAVKSNLASAR